jgi:hypothetical protein
VSAALVDDHGVARVVDLDGEQPTAIGSECLRVVLRKLS